MTLKDLYQLEKERDRALNNAKQMALQFTLNADSLNDYSFLKRSCKGFYSEYERANRKIDRISQHLFNSCWAVAKTFGKEIVEARKLKEGI